MKKMLFITPMAALIFSGCGMDLGRVNYKIFPKKSNQLEIQCGKNLDLCLQRATLKCGYTGYKLLSKEKRNEEWTIRVQCRK
ncbi:hypothetical protein [Nitratiruptor sp. SB155-2]|uniref:hypothetical protein n=1 Tax=Nitratiruptor sp. (strain SB155-2) TaxID=387092 RepID=UPI00030DB222|nr:hypothetical protein [Nitratiruptor sp. SB155-2]